MKVAEEPVSVHSFGNIAKLTETSPMGSNWSASSSLPFAEFDVKEIRGLPALGFFRLVVYVDAFVQSRPVGEDISVTNISAEMWVSGKGSQDHYLGYLRRRGAEVPFVTSPQARRTNLELELEMDARRVEGIEKIRLGEGLLFKMRLYGMANDGHDKRVHPVDAELRHPLNVSGWIDVLKEAEYRQSMLLEIPMPDETAGSPFPKAAKHLQTAQTHLLRGHFREAVGACRDVMETVSVSLGDKKQKAPNEIEAWFADTRGMGKEERLRILRRAFTLLTHAARHADAVAVGIEWGPEDARMAIVMAATLMQAAGEGRQ